jgi:hypothetical protein
MVLTGNLSIEVPHTPHKLYGVPQDLSTIQLVTPDLSHPEFLWNEAQTSQGGTPPLQLECPAAAVDPPGGHYPRSPKFSLSPRTQSYMRGYAYVSSWDTANREEDRQRLLLTRMPPNVEPSREESGSLRIEPIPGMTKLIPGVPFVYHLDGDPSQPVTVACLQTLNSLEAYPDIADEAKDLTDQLYSLTFGKVHTGKLVQKPIYQFPDLRRNQRSAQVPEGSFDGSFNLTATLGQGEGQGCYMPAAQSLDPDLRQTIAEVTLILHRLYRMILPRSISKFEWDLIEFHSKVNNIFGFGGFEPNNSGLQMNVSSGFSSLTELIGEHQGTFHTDIHDHPPSYTVCTLCFKLPKGMYSSPLTFLLPFDEMCNRG